MLSFRPLTPEDRQWVHPLLYGAGRTGCEWSFCNLYFWAFYYGGVAKVGEFLCQRSERCWGKPTYFFPAGRGEVFPVLEALRQDAAERGEPLRLCPITREDMAVLDRLYPGKFQYQSRRESWDYVYPIDRLADLPGRKLQSKRNHCSRFCREHPGWRTEGLAPECVPQVEAFLEKWYAAREESPAMAVERRAMAEALKHWEAFAMEGLLLWDGEELLAVSVGNRITPEVYDVNFEKALPGAPDAYAMINREFSARIRETYPQVRWLNREDDLGLEGLRRAKESYQPELLEKYMAWMEE